MGAQLRSLKSKLKYAYFSFGLFTGDLHRAYNMNFLLQVCVALQSLIDRINTRIMVETTSRGGEGSLYPEKRNITRDSAF